MLLKANLLGEIPNYVLSTFNTIGLGSTITYKLPEPTQSVWDFDHEAVTSWDSDVVTTGTSQLNSAIDSAMQASSGTYHRITVTDTVFSSIVNLYLTTPIPSDDVYILIQSQSNCIFSNRLKLNGPSNCKWVGFEMHGNASLFDSPCVELIRPKVRFSFHDCKIGNFFAGLFDPSVYPAGFTSAGTNDRSLCVKNSEIRGVTDALGLFSGTFNISNNLITDFIGDVIKTQIDGSGSNHSYLYVANNVALDSADYAPSGSHPDFIQTGNSLDASTDEYRVEAFQNIYIGGNVAQNVTQGIFCSLDKGSARGCTLISENNVILASGNNGINLSDRRSVVSGCMIAKPPTGARIPTTPPFPSTLQVQELRLRGDAIDGQSSTPVINGVLFGGFNDVEPWGVTPINTITADHRQPLGGPESYDTVFPNMTGLIYDTDQVVIPSYAGSRDIASVRSYVANEYQPLGGWSSIGMVSPADWS